MGKTTVVDHEETVTLCAPNSRKFFVRLGLDSLLMLLDALLAGVYAAKEEFDLSVLWSISFVLSAVMLGRDVWEYHNDGQLEMSAPDMPSNSKD